MGAIKGSGLSTHKGFTLVEAVLAILILGLAAGATAAGVMTMFRSQRESHNMLLANSFAQAAIEEVKTRASNPDDFDILQTIFPGGAWAPCAAQFPMFERHIRVIASPAPLSNNLKQGIVTVRLMRDQGGGRRTVERQWTYSDYFAYPPQLLPGSISGAVSKQDDGSPILGALVTAFQSQSNKPYTTTEHASGQRGNYTYQPGDYVFMDHYDLYSLQPGQYQVYADKPGFQRGYHPGAVTVVSGERTPNVDVQLQVLPEPGYIEVLVFNDANGNDQFDQGEPGVPNVRVYFRKAGQYLGYKKTNSAGMVLKKFEPGRYTAYTYYAYRHGYCGNIPDPAYNVQHNHHGLTSSRDIYSFPNQASLDAPWGGSSVYDCIDVISEQTTRYNLPLAKIPTVVLMGHVKDRQQPSYPIESARVDVYWFNWVWIGRTYSAALTSGDPGAYSIGNVPKQSYIFGPSASYHQRVRAYGGSSQRVVAEEICGYGTDYKRAAMTVNPTVVDLYLPEKKCGRVTGTVIDRDQPTTSLSGVRVDISGGGTGWTDTSGVYWVPHCRQAPCNQTVKFRVPVGNRTVRGRKSGYYDHYCSGCVKVREGQTTTYDFEMIPIYVGKINGTVQRQTADPQNPAPVENAKIKVLPYSGAPGGPATVTYTASDGTYELYVVETRDTKRHCVEASRQYYHTATKSDIDVTGYLRLTNYQGQGCSATTVDFTLIKTGAGL
jgi:type II secretory pathway pseudopilin PulG